jgi:23S rRNA pseudouridine1911/1915/1917 synthase
MKLSDCIIEETNNWVALHKPAGLLSIPDREGKEVSLKELLKQAYGNIFTVHRLDRDTSGLIIFAKNEAAHKHLSVQFEHRETKKIYQGIVLGAPANT